MLTSQADRITGLAAAPDILTTRKTPQKLCGVLRAFSFGESVRPAFFGGARPILCAVIFPAAEPGLFTRMRLPSVGAGLCGGFSLLPMPDGSVRRQAFSMRVYLTAAT